MKKFILKLFVFIFFGILIISILETIERSSYHPLREKKELLQTRIDFEYFFIGPSHLYRGIIPELISKNAINLSFNGQGLLYSFHFLKLAIQSQSNVKIVFLDLSYPTFTIGLNETSFHVMNSRYFHYTGYSDFVNVASINPKRYSELLSFNGHGIKKLLGITSQKESEPGNLGYIGARNNDGSNNVDNVTIDNFNKQLYFHQYYKVLDEMFRFSLTQKIKIIGIIPPVTKPYISSLNYKELAKVQEAISKIQKKYKIEILDFQGHPSFTNIHFYDTHHLNDQGARVLSNLIRSFIFQN